MAVRGWVYVITNQAMPGLVKVGYSTKDPVLRAEELGSTGVPHPFEVVFDALVNSPREVEQRAHLRLAGRRERKEWFRCSASEAISAIRVEAQEILQEALHRPDLVSMDEVLLRRANSVSSTAEDARHTGRGRNTHQGFVAGEIVGAKSLGNCSHPSCFLPAVTTFSRKPLCAQHGTVARDSYRDELVWGRRAEK